MNWLKGISIGSVLLGLAVQGALAAPVQIVRVTKSDDRVTRTFLLELDNDNSLQSIIIHSDDGEPDGKYGQDAIKAGFSTVEHRGCVLRGRYLDFSSGGIISLDTVRAWPSRRTFRLYLRHVGGTHWELETVGKNGRRPIDHIRFIMRRIRPGVRMVVFKYRDEEVGRLDLDNCHETDPEACP